MIISKQIAEINGCKLIIEKECENEKDYVNAPFELEVTETIVKKLLYNSVYKEEIKEEVDK